MVKEIFPNTYSIGFYTDTGTKLQVKVKMKQYSRDKQGQLLFI